MSWGEKEVTVLLLCCVTVIRQEYQSKNQTSADCTQWYWCARKWYIYKHNCQERLLISNGADSQIAPMVRPDT